MITGCNTNVLYRGKQFHVQTEDSGRANPHIISHVYHGGTIIASEKSEYGDRVDATEIDIKVRAKIELQHKTMLKRLTSGELDELIEERIGGLKPAEKPPPPRAVEPSVEPAAAEGPPRAAEPSVAERAAAPAIAKSAARAVDDSVAKSAARAAEDSIAKRAARVAGASATKRAAVAPDAAGSTASAGDTAGSTASGADSTGSITAGAATDPSMDGERPVADTEPLLDGKTTPGFGTPSDSEKPLDEVILEYLVDKARGRSAGKQQPPARRQRRKG